MNDDDDDNDNDNDNDDNGEGKFQGRFLSFIPFPDTRQLGENGSA